MSPPYPSLYLRLSISLPRDAPRASASCVFLSLGRYPLSLGAGRSLSVSRFFSPSLSSSLALPFSLPLPLVLRADRRRNPLDVSELLTLFYQPSVVDRPECDWPFSVGTIPERFRVMRLAIRSSSDDSTMTAERRIGCTHTHTRSTRAILSSVSHVDQSGVVGARGVRSSLQDQDDRQTLGASSRQPRMLRYRYLMFGSHGSTQYRARSQWRWFAVWGCFPPLSLSPFPTLRTSPLFFGTVRRSEIRSWRSMNARVERPRRYAYVTRVQDVGAGGWGGGGCRERTLSGAWGFSIKRDI